MPDHASRARELGLLEEKLRTTGLSPEEEARRAALIEALAAPAPARGFDVNAAAAEVKALLGPGAPEAPSPAPLASPYPRLDVQVTPGPPEASPPPSPEVPTVEPSPQPFYDVADYGLDPDDPSSAAWAEWYRQQGWDPATAYAWAVQQNTSSGAASPPPASPETGLDAGAPTDLAEPAPEPQAPVLDAVDAVSDAPLLDALRYAGGGSFDPALAGGAEHFDAPMPAPAEGASEPAPLAAEPVDAIGQPIGEWSTRYLGASETPPDPDLPALAAEPTPGHGSTDDRTALWELPKAGGVRAPMARSTFEGHAGAIDVIPAIPEPAEPWTVEQPAASVLELAPLPPAGASEIQDGDIVGSASDLPPTPRPPDADLPLPAADGLPEPLEAAPPWQGEPVVPVESLLAAAEPAAAEPPVAEAIVAEPPASAPAAAEPPPERAAVVAGTHRVVVHTSDGQVRRGLLTDAALDAEEITLTSQGGLRESLRADGIKAIFFMLPLGATPPAAEGKKVRVTFRDGRQVAGFSPDYAPDRPGFFMVPVDTRTHTARIWVFRSAVRQVSVS